MILGRVGTLVGFVTCLLAVLGPEPTLAVTFDIQSSQGPGIDAKIEFIDGSFTFDNNEQSSLGRHPKPAIGRHLKTGHRG